MFFGTYSRKLVVAQLIPHFSIQDLAFFDGKNHKVSSAAKMLADRFSIIGDDRNFHD
jgi:hypothetical protein